MQSALILMELLEDGVGIMQACKGCPVQVLAMTNLVAAYQQNDIMAFERILCTNK